MTISNPVPTTLARPAGVDEVIRIVRHAELEGLTVSVDQPGADQPEGAILIDLSLFDAVAVNSHIGTMRVQAGASAEELERASSAHGVTLAAAASAATGIAALAGSRRPFGPSRESLLEAALVLPDGTFVRANAEENADLLADVRDGQDGIGVVLSYLFETEPTG
jgi:FAD/FMN-containing dehydrogenase